MFRLRTGNWIAGTNMKTLFKVLMRKPFSFEELLSKAAVHLDTPDIISREKEVFYQVNDQGASVHNLYKNEFKQRLGKIAEGVTWEEQRQTLIESLIELSGWVADVRHLNNSTDPEIYALVMNRLFGAEDTSFTGKFAIRAMVAAPLGKGLLHVGD
ncbi:hypothetical protein [Tropicimonas aquimaris]|uniref:Site-specific DNA-methyltransferase (adenine-specific) n=1 Tax=Tropicimonas aquimaris TaxID=914152 RepID=A0ABW3IW75_9RHOB